MQISQPVMAEDSQPVTVLNWDVNYSLFVPKDLVWGAKSLTAADKAIEFQSKEINNALNVLKGKGAVKVVKSFLKNPVVRFSDWKTYVPSISQYVLVGFTSKGKQVGVSAKIPSDVPNLASRLVTLSQSPCSLESSDAPSLQSCSITIPKREVYLRAALRTSLGIGQVMDMGGDIITQLETCLTMKSPFTIKNGIFDCPANARIFGGARSFKMSDSFQTRSYSIKVDATKYKAIFTYGPLDLTSIALKGAYDSGSVVRFG